MPAPIRADDIAIGDVLYLHFPSRGFPPHGSLVRVQAESRNRFGAVNVGGDVLSYALLARDGLIVGRRGPSSKPHPEPLDIYLDGDPNVARIAAAIAEAKTARASASQ